MALEAVLITDRRLAEPPWLKRGRDGWLGQQSFRVNTHLCEKAITVAPPYGSAWSGDFPDLQVVGQATRYLAKKDDPASGPPTYGGITIVTNDYATPGAGGHLPPPTPSMRFSEIAYQSEPVTVKYGIDFAGPGNLADPIGNGDGAAKLVGVVTARVYMYLAVGQSPDWSRLWRLTREKLLNSEAVLLPPVPGSVNQIPVGTGMARYEGFTPALKNGLLEVVHELTLAPAADVGDPFDVIWQEENKEGKAVATRWTTIYEKASFAGLW